MALYIIVFATIFFFIGGFLPFLNGHQGHKLLIIAVITLLKIVYSEFQYVYYTFRSCLAFFFRFPLQLKPLLSFLVSRDHTEIYFHIKQFTYYNGRTMNNVGDVKVQFRSIAFVLLQDSSFMAEISRVPIIGQYSGISILPLLAHTVSSWVWSSVLWPFQ